MEKKQFEIIIKEVFEKGGISLNQKQIEDFYRYFCLLLEWNEKINLTAILDPKEIIEKHFFDSIISLKYIKEDSCVLDLGTGAGFPSIPLKILRPDIKFVLIDSVNKKLLFINEVIKNLELNNIVTIHSRAEDLAKNKKYRESFDYVLTRAVGKLNILCEYCLPFLKIGGEMISYKSSEISEEVNIISKALNVLGGKLKIVEDVSFLEYKRFLVFIIKEKISPIKYPRGLNKPRTDPLV